MFYRIDGVTLCEACGTEAEGESIRTIHPEAGMVCADCGTDGTPKGESFEARSTRHMTDVDWLYEESVSGGMDPDWYADDR
jgi:hypothetical protein